MNQRPCKLCHLNPRWSIMKKICVVILNTNPCGVKRFIKYVKAHAFVVAVTGPTKIRSAVRS